MIDLHTHTNESDGTYTPEELVQAAVKVGLEALAITDHDTFNGYNQALEYGRQHGLELVCGLEMTTRLEVHRDFTIHVLAYFLQAAPAEEFKCWLEEILVDRHDRNVRLIENLKAAGIDIELSEVEAMGRTLTGRPHFARVLVKKGYAASIEDAFRRYLGETAPSYAERHAPQTAYSIQRLRKAGGLPVLAHPVRLGFRDHAAEEELICELRDEGLEGLEVYHSDHSSEDVRRYEALAKKLGLAITGGSDFHGGTKPRISLGTGFKGNVNVPRQLLDDLRTRAAR